jgi:trehalose 6-phosphate phosphatase
MRSESRPSLNSSVEQKLKNPMALFLDFDGTLVSIVRSPELAVLDSPGRNLIRGIARKTPLVIVSGRSLRDVRSRVGVGGLTYVGNHGLEISGPGIRRRMKGADEWIRFLRGLAGKLHRDLDGIPGIFVEEKRLTLSVHYRLAGREGRRRALRLFSERIRSHRGGSRIRVSHGKAVWEVRPPVDWNKGSAVRWLLRQPGFRGRWPLYIGDDRTDQDALRAIRGSGIGIAVGGPAERGAAHFVVENPRRVRQFLRWLMERLSRKSGAIRRV